MAIQCSGELENSAVVDTLTESALTGATACQTLQHFDSLQKAVDDATKARRIIDADILREIRKRRDEFVVECLPQALNFVREVQSFGIHFERVLAAITQSLRDPNSTNWRASFTNLGKDIDAIIEQAKTLDDALKYLYGRLDSDEKALDTAMTRTLHPGPNADLKKKVLAAVVGAGIVGAIIVGIALAVITGGATYVLAHGVFQVGTVKALGLASVAASPVLIGTGAVVYYIGSVKDAMEKLRYIQQRLQAEMSDLANVRSKWIQIKLSVQRVERKLEYEMDRESILGDLEQLKNDWHDNVVVPAQRLPF